MKLLLSLLAAFQISIAQAQENSINDDSQKQLESKIIKEYGLDTLDIHFDFLPRGFLYPHLAFYIPWSDSLRLNYYGIVKTAERTSRDLDSLISNVMNHELAHYKVDKLMEKHNLKSALEDPYSRHLLEAYISILVLNKNEPGGYVPILNKFIDMKHDELVTILLDKTINEGVGYHYEDPNKELTIVTWPSSIYSILKSDDYGDFMIYNGRSLMYPIIKEYGWKGVEYVLTHMPTVDDFPDLLGYQKKILEELANQH